MTDPSFNKSLDFDSEFKTSQTSSYQQSASYGNNTTSTFQTKADEYDDEEAFADDEILLQQTDNTITALIPTQSHNIHDDHEEQGFADDDVIVDTTKTVYDYKKHLCESSDEIGFADDDEHTIGTRVNGHQTTLTLKSDYNNYIPLDTEIITIKTGLNEDDMLTPQPFIIRYAECLRDVVLVLIGLFITVAGTMMTFGNMKESFQQC